MSLLIKVKEIQLNETECHCTSSPLCTHYFIHCFIFFLLLFQAHITSRVSRAMTHFHKNGLNMTSNKHHNLHVHLYKYIAYFLLVSMLILFLVNSVSLSFFEFGQSTLKLIHPLYCLL